MIERKNDTSRNLEKALQALEQAKQRVANEKKKQNEKKRKADWAIHDSENDKGQRNLHVHVLLTMRPITENGEWVAKKHQLEQPRKRQDVAKRFSRHNQCRQ